MEYRNDMGANAQNLLAEFIPSLTRMKLIHVTPTHAMSMWTGEPRPDMAMHWQNGLGATERAAAEELVKLGLATIDESFPSVELTEAGAARWVEIMGDFWPRA